MAQTVKVSVADQTCSGGWPSVVLGPLRLREPDEIKQTFARLAGQGPLNRFGLHPATNRRWSFDPTSPDAWQVTRDSDHYDPADTDRELTRMLAGSATSPITVSLRGDYALMTYDHGLGDGHFFLLLLAVVGGDETAVRNVFAKTQLDRPLALALRESLRNHGKEVVGSVSEFARTRSSLTADPAVTTGGKLTTPPIFVSATSGNDFLAELRRAAADHEPASVMSVLTTATMRALRNHGIEQHPVAGVTVDLRRYLPAGTSTLANFMSMVKVPATPGVRPQELHHHLQNGLSSYWPLIGYGLGTGVGLLRRHVPEWGTTEVIGTKRARLVFTDLRGIPAAKSFAWAESTQTPQFAVTVPLGLEDQISILTFPTRDAGIQMSATFQGGAFDADMVRAALNDVVGDPVGAAAGV